MIDDGIRLLLNVAGEFYESVKATDGTNMERALELASKNRLLYHFSCKAIHLVEEGYLDTKVAVLQQMYKVRSEGEAYFDRFRCTYNLVSEVLGEEHLLFKTFKVYPCICNDLDILVPDLFEAGSKFKQLGYHTVQDEPYKMSIENRNYLPISIHERVAWGKLTVLDEEIMWSGSHVEKIKDIEVKVPSIEGDLTAVLCHIPFETLQVTIGDLLAIYYFSRIADWKKIIEQTENYGWCQTLVRIAGILNSLHRSLFEKPSPIERVIPSLVRVKPYFPYKLPLLEICKAHVEKRAWEKIVKIPFFIGIRVGKQCY